MCLCVCEVEKETGREREGRGTERDVGKGRYLTKQVDWTLIIWEGHSLTNPNAPTTEYSQTISNLFLLSALLTVGN